MSIEHGSFTVERVLRAIPARVFAAWSSASDQRMSVSLATIELHAVSGGTRLVITEQGVFLDERWDNAGREQGTRGLLEQLAAAVEAAA